MEARNRDDGCVVTLPCEHHVSTPERALLGGKQRNRVFLDTEMLRRIVFPDIVSSRFAKCFATHGARAHGVLTW